MDIISVVIADDHVIFRKGLSTILNEIAMVKVVAETSNGNELLEYLKTGTADVVLMDIKMPGMDGVEATRRLGEKYPDISVIALTMHEEIGYFNKMIEAGARGFLLKKLPRISFMKQSQPLSGERIILQKNLLIALARPLHPAG